MSPTARRVLIATWVVTRFVLVSVALIVAAFVGLFVTGRRRY